MSYIKKLLAKIPGVYSIYSYIKQGKEFFSDFNFFYKNFSHSKITLNKTKYNIILIVHSLEKGMCNKKPRRFGERKIINLINLLNLLNEKNKNDYSFLLGINALRSYCNFYKNNNWTKTEEYIKASTFIKKHNNCKNLKVGAHEISKKEIIKDINIDYNKFISSRHSVRNFSNIPLKKADINKALNIAIKTPSACNRQMIKVYSIMDEQKKKYTIQNGQGFSGFDVTGAQIFIITFDVNANYFVGERNQGWFNAGLFSMNFVNALHSLGIGSCFIQFANSFKDEQKMKKTLKIPHNERIAVILAAGYYDDISTIPYSTRKDIKDIYTEI